MIGIKCLVFDEEHPGTKKCLNIYYITLYTGSGCTEKLLKWRKIASWIRWEKEN